MSKAVKGKNNQTKFAMFCRFLMTSLCGLFLCFSAVDSWAASQNPAPSNISEIRTRRIVEDNGIADFLCKIVSLMRSDVAKVMVAFSLFSMGIGTFFGKLTIGWFFSFALGCAVFFGSVNVLSLFAPYSDIGDGCNCSSTMIVGSREDGSGYIRMKTYLNKDCSHVDDPKDMGAPLQDDDDDLKGVKGAGNGQDVSGI
ncbi:TrbC/VirB2 family protein [Rickettsiales bacterium]|nr:TrbC/VirB2 family protein [Rickettsiales bacterium]